MAADSNGLFTSFVPAEAQEAVTNALQESLVDLIDLSLVAKQAHWSVVGPRFRSIHLALDEVSAEFTSDDKVVLVMTEALEAAIKRLRANIGRVGDDPVTEDLLIGISARLEQLHWMWQAQSV